MYALHYANEPGLGLGLGLGLCCKVVGIFFQIRKLINNTLPVVAMRFSLFVVRLQASH